jgi:hypothetical protein
MLKKSFAGHGPAPQKSQVIDLSLWGGATRCQKSVRCDFFSSLLQRAGGQFSARERGLKPAPAR